MLKGQLKIIKNKKSKKYLAAAAAAVMVFSMTPDVSCAAEPAAAVSIDSSALEWNPEDEMHSGETYILSENASLNTRLVIPENCKLIIKDSVIFTIEDGVSFIINGDLQIEPGAVIRSYGRVTAADNSAIDIQGILIIKEKGFFTTHGRLNVAEGGFLNVYGSFTTADTAEIAFNSNVFFRIDSKININSDITVYEHGYLEVYHSFTIRKNIRAVIYGTMNIRSTAELTLFGSIDIKEGGLLSGKGVVDRTRFLSVSNAGEITVNMPPPPPVTTSEGLTYVGEILLVNKQYGLPSDYDPGFQNETRSAYREMKKAAESSGFELEVISDYRSYSTQQTAYTYWTNLYGKEYASMISAQPGHSEHQTGYAIDISSLEQSYGNTPEGRWLAENCWKYGFILRYPKDKTDITGYYYEPWHVRYLGKELAEMVYQSNLCLEEFLGLA